MKVPLIYNRVTVRKHKISDQLYYHSIKYNDKLVEIENFYKPITVLNFKNNDCKRV